MPNVLDEWFFDGLYQVVDVTKDLDSVYGLLDPVIVETLVKEVKNLNPSMKVLCSNTLVH